MVYILRLVFYYIQSHSMFLELGQKHNFENYLHGPYLNVTHYGLLN